MNSPFPRYFKCKGNRETLAPERGYGKYTSNMAARETVPRGVIYCCVPLCQSRNPYFDGIEPCLTDRGDQRPTGVVTFLSKLWGGEGNEPDNQIVD